MITLKKAMFLSGVFLLLFTGSCTDENTGLGLNGTWHVEENSQLFGLQHYDAEITQLDSTRIEISNFYDIGAGSFVTAAVQGREISINNQKVDGYTFAGSGEISADYNAITFVFTVNDGAVVDHAIAQYNR